MLNTLRKKNMKRKLYSTLALASGLLCTLLFVNASEQSSIKNGKFSILTRHRHDRSPANYNKARAPISVSLKRIDESSDSDMIRLQGTVKALRNFQNLKLSWAVPADVQVLSGSIEEQVSLEAGSSQTFEILLAPKTRENRQVYFHATSDEFDGANFGASAQYNTTKQEVIAQELKENFLKARAKVRSGELRKIIF